MKNNNQKQHPSQIDMTVSYEKFSEEKMIKLVESYKKFNTK